MKKLHSKKQNKIIITIIAIVMLCNFVMPNYSYAKTEKNDGGQIFDPIAKLLTFVCDNVFQFLQETFVTMDKIEAKEGEYNFQYSPAKIFSGTVPAFDINFIEPNTEYYEKADFSSFVYKTSERWRKIFPLMDLYNKKAIKFPDGMADDIDFSYDYKNPKDYREAIHHDGAKLINKRFNLSSRYWTYYWIESNQLHMVSKIKIGWFGKTFYYAQTFEVNDALLSQLNSNEYAKYESIAGQLQNSIVSWYKALRRISLIGLLSVLVYVGIRIVANSISGEDNSKHKKMLTDWIIAICLLFTLHYLMNLIIIVTGKISSFFSVDVTDPILNDLRTNIFKAGSWSIEISKVIMYIILTIYTVIFTFQYLRRVIYMAFFTMIAPLITLTYPLDKISDGKAQAFNMWIREYVFNALIQIVHLILYFVLVSSAETLIIHYPIIGIVTIGFMTQAEKIIRKMFGFENVTTVGTLQAAAASGLMINALNKLKKPIKMPKPKN